MAVKKQRTPKVRWDQSEFEKIKATWSPERVAADEKALNEVFRQAADSPLLMEEIKWAREHGVKFFIDHTVTGAAGYYWPGTGVMAISGHTSNSLIEVLAHELRHAWQDYHGLIAWDDHKSNEGEFTKFFINDALIEADAHAYGRRARDEAELTRLRRQHKRIPPRLKKYASHENADLMVKFMSWFSVYASQYYGGYFSKKYGIKWGVYDGELPPRNYEHQPVEPNLPGIDIHDRQHVLRLGINFSGNRNYLAAMPPDVLPKLLLRPSLANVFWGVANKQQRELTTQLRKAYLKKKLAPENRKPRHPWP